MKIVIFAGGQGKRLWPLSRKKTPKQFQKIFGEETTLENSFNTIGKKFRPEDIFISTGEEFVEDVYRAIPSLPKENLILEPEARDTAAAVAYAMLRISQKFPDEPVVIRWQNSLIKDPEQFLKTLDFADSIFKNNEAELVYLAVPVKFPNTGVGYINLGNKVREGEHSIELYEFQGFKEKPNQEKAEEYFKSQSYCWNPGCYITTPKFLLDNLEKYAPQIYSPIRRIGDSIGRVDEHDVIVSEFKNIEKISIDYALWEKLPINGVKVVKSDYNWNYVSTWSDLKKALQSTSEENITKGNVEIIDSKNSLVYNYDEGKMIALVGVEGIQVIDCGDSLLICSEESAGKIKDLVSKLEEKSPHLT